MDYIIIMVIIISIISMVDNIVIVIIIYSNIRRLIGNNRIIDFKLLIHIWKWLKIVMIGVWSILLNCQWWWFMITLTMVTSPGGRCQCLLHFQTMLTAQWIEMLQQIMCFGVCEITTRIRTTIRTTICHGANTTNWESVIMMWSSKCEKILHPKIARKIVCYKQGLHGRL